MRLAALLLVLLTLVAAGHLAFAEQVEETGPDGAVVLRYATDDDGMRHGGCIEYHENGKVKARSQYKHGKLHGPFNSYDDKGRRAVTTSYKDGALNGRYLERDAKGRPVVESAYDRGRLHGKRTISLEGAVLSTQTWEHGEPIDIDGVRPYPKSQDRIRLAIEEIFNSTDPLEENADDPKARARGESLRILKIYRFLCDLPYADLVLDTTFNRHADAGAALCERIGRLDHTPANPGMPEDEYEFAYTGTSRSNLYVGTEQMEAQVGAYMDDSDARNIDRVGHRRWCLNPRMVKTGFGSSGRYGAMWAHDASRKKVPAFDFVAYPPPGHMPLHYFGDHYAWSISLAPGKFDKPNAGQVKATIQPMDEDFVRRRPALELNYHKLSKEGMGLKHCLIFRPKDFKREEGAHYWVEVTGLTHRGKPAPLQFIVGFFEL